MRILVVNAGSSTLKLAVFDDGDVVVGSATIDPWAGADDTDSIRDFLDRNQQVDVVGHRIVHGGDRFGEPVLLTPEVYAALEALTDLAPLHQPRALAGIEAVGSALPGVPMVGCFDTAFHRSMPAAAATYALPLAWQERFGLRRFGFHGLSHAYAARRAAQLVQGELDDLHIVTCHLGAGASVCAVSGGVSVDTTMGFTPLEGVVMATRSGSVDPGLLLWLLQARGIGVDELAQTLEHASGLAGMTSTSGDMREVQAAADAGQPAALLAIDVYVHRLRAAIASMAAAMSGIDVLAFTGGVGEHHPRIRAAVVARLDFLDAGVDLLANAETSTDAEITASGRSTLTVVVTSREDLEIARQVRQVVTGEERP